MALSPKWERLLASQAIQSASIVGNLNEQVCRTRIAASRVVEGQFGDKGHLRERQDVLEAAHRQQNRSFFEIEATLKGAKKRREKGGNVLSADSLRSSTSSAVSRLSDALASAQQAGVRRATSTPGFANKPRTPTRSGRGSVPAEDALTTIRRAVQDLQSSSRARTSASPRGTSRRQGRRVVAAVEQRPALTG